MQGTATHVTTNACGCIQGCGSLEQADPPCKREPCYHASSTLKRKRESISNLRAKPSLTAVTSEVVGLEKPAMAVVWCGVVSIRGAVARLFCNAHGGLLCSACGGVSAEPLENPKRALAACRCASTIEGTVVSSSKRLTNIMLTPYLWAEGLRILVETLLHSLLCITINSL
jgi:hypothetical protein